MNTYFENRIVSSGTANPKDLKANAFNWRKHPDVQRKAMKDVLGNIGWIQDVIINKTTGNIIDGHLRVETALKNNELEIPVKYVELTVDEEKIALATFDPISAMAEQDSELLDKLVESIDSGAIDFNEILGLNNDISGVSDDTTYTKTINIPQYEITGDCPCLKSLIDTQKTEQLRKNIEASNVPDDIKEFLIIASYRHIVFNYRNIAEYYAHSDKDVQRLFEESALVIIDIGNAIANGYAELSNGIKEIMEK